MVNGKQLVDTLMIAVIDEDMLEGYTVIARNECCDRYQVRSVEVVMDTRGQRTIYIDFDTESRF